jgi:hypothetical protein
MLRAHYEDQAAEREAAANLWKDHDLVFCGADGKPLDPRRDWAEWGDILKAAGVPHHGVHVQRHTAATVLKRRGVASDATFRRSREDGAVRDAGPGATGRRSRRKANPQVRRP